MHKEKFFLVIIKYNQMNTHFAVDVRLHVILKSVVIRVRQGQIAGTCECGNEPSGSIKCGEFLDWLKNSLACQEGLFN
jgi:hypothetical protein